MRVKLVEIISHEEGWKGTWYRTGQRHFVERNPLWPSVVRQRWIALTPNVCGGINHDDCMIVTGLGAWLCCLLFTWKRAAGLCRP